MSLTTNGSKTLAKTVKDLRWSNGKPVKRDWLTAMLQDIENEAINIGYDRGVNAVRRYNPDAMEPSDVR